MAVLQNKKALLLGIFSDSMIPSVALAQGFGRIGLAGCLVTAEKQKGGLP